MRGTIQLLATCLLGVLVLFAAPACGDMSFEEAVKRATFVEPNAHLQLLGEISDTEGSLARTFFSPAHKKAAAQILAWMEEAGMETWIDVIGNVHGRINGTERDAQAVLVGSHYDTVLDAGKYDGNLGVITAIAAVKTLLIMQLEERGRLSEVSVAESGNIVIPSESVNELLKSPVHVIGFTDEEGVRFQSTFLGSRALAGSLVKYNMLAAKDKTGMTVAEAADLPTNPEELSRVLDELSMPADKIQEYIEVHIEQGPVLERDNLPLGIVSTIAGQSRLWLTIDGTQGHAGTVPMKGRADSLTAAADVILHIEHFCGGGPDFVSSDTFTDEDMLVCTVGEMRIWPSASNVIAGQVQLSLDIRAKDDDLRKAIVKELTLDIKDLCADRGVKCLLKHNHDAASVNSDKKLVMDLVAAAEASYKLLKVCGPSCQPPGASLDEAMKVPVIVSGAGHDAMAMAEVTKMAMMFVRCKGGVSHSPLEHVEEADVAAATAALSMYLQNRLAPEM